MLVDWGETNSHQTFDFSEMKVVKICYKKWKLQDLNVDSNIYYTSLNELYLVIYLIKK